MKRVKNKSNLVISAFLGLSIVIFSTWGAVAPLLVYALPPALLKARTIAELILTLFAGSGTAVTNTPVLQSIYAYDTAYYSMESMIQNDVLVPVDTTLTKEEAIAALGTANNHTSPFNLDADAFRQYVLSNWQGMKDYGVDTVLRFQELANTDSVYGAIDNLGQIIKNVANYGYLGASNTIAIVANPGSVATVTLRNILDAIKNTYGSLIRNNVGINNVKNYGITGFYCIGEGTANYNVKTLFFLNENIAYAFYGSFNEGNSNQIGCIAYNPLDHDVRSAWVIDNDAPRYSTIHSRRNYNELIGGWNGWTWWENLMGSPYFSTQADAEAYLQQFRDDPDLINTLNNSPDVINQDQGNINNLNSVEPIVGSDEVLYPIDSSDYRDFVDESNDNRGITNAPIMQELLDPYISEVPEYNEPWENPDIPGTNPIVPDQPDMPDQPSFTDSEIENALVPNAEGLTSVFPFCIPWDIYAFVKGFEIDREAPVIVWRFQSEHFDIDHTFVIDLSGFDDVANILRKVELILFIIGLAIETRKIIGA